MFRAYGNRVVVDITEEMNRLKAKSAIELPENIRVSPVAIAKVISVGPGVMTQFGWDAPKVKVGDVVAFERARSQKLPDKNIAALWAGDILGVERDDDFPSPMMNGKLVEANRG